jgi:hypothetical protein
MNGVYELKYICWHCGKEFDSNVDRKFCSRKCWNEGWKGKKTHAWAGGEYVSGGRVFVHKDLVEDEFKCMCNTRGYVRRARLVMARKIGRALKGNEVVHHKNGDKKDDRPENLRLFESDNEHKKEHIVDIVRGEEVWCSKLTEDDVKEIKKCLERGETHRSIAKKFGVTHRRVGDIARGKSWKHVGKEVD